MAETLYVAGPMTGLPEYNYPAFHRAAVDLRAKGYTVLNPAENIITGPDAADESKAWRLFMRISVKQIAEADGIAHLDGCSGSRGAAFELFLASQLGLLVMPVADWLRAAAS